jgi:hypothetical protein
MAVTPLENGEIITKADIQAAFNDVRTIVNAVPQENVGRLSLGQQHVGTLTATDTTGSVKGYDSGQITTSVTVSKRSTSPETIANVTTQYQHLALTAPGWRITNGGLGYAMRPGKVLAWATVRVSEFTASSNDGRQMFWCALTWRRSTDVADQVNIQDIRFCFLDDSGTALGLGLPTIEERETLFGNASQASGLPREDVAEDYGYVEPGNNLARICEHNIMLWTIIDASAQPGVWTLSRLEVKAAICRGSSNDPTNAISAIIAGGTIGFVALNDR